MKFLRNFSRLLVGAVFIFSGFVKGIDPLGTTYRIEDYFIAYGMDWGIPMALFLSVFLSTLEFFLGVALVLNLKIKYLSWILFPMMAFFTLLTFYDALFEPVPDCGCFGDAITLSNWKTFYKNIVLILLVSVIFFQRKKYHPPYPWLVQVILGLIFGLGFGGYSYYNYNHLPVIDFRNWTVGSNMNPDNQGEVKIYLTYRNKETGETREYLSPDYPWNDSIWMSNWEFVSQRIDDSEVVKGHQLVIETEEGADVTDDFINNPAPQLLVIAHDLTETHRPAFGEINELYKKAESEGISMIVITSSLPGIVEQFKKDMKLDPYLEFYHADDVVLKTMIRANPGLMLLEDAYVLGKWHYNDIPDFNEIQKKYLSE